MTTPELDTAKRKASRTVEAVKKRASTLPDEAKDAAAKLANEAKARTTTVASDARDKVADDMEGAADTLHSAADDMTDEAPHTRAIAAAADRLDTAAGALQNIDIGRLTRDVTSFARRNPQVFIAGAVLAGFALGRFLKASTPDTHDPAEHRSDVTPHHLPQPRTQA
jgi:predicted component of type VI protein secretion system